MGKQGTRKNIDSSYLGEGNEKEDRAKDPNSDSLEGDVEYYHREGGGL